MKSILGISAFYHDSAACLLKNGKIIAAAQEERFTRKNMILVILIMVEFVLKYGNLRLSEVDHIVFFEKPFLKFERLLETYVAFAQEVLHLLQKQCLCGLRKNFFKNFLFNKLKAHDENYKSDLNIFF